MITTHTKQHWQDTEWNIFKQDLTTLLTAGQTTVVFTKSDNTERVMRCTLNHQLLPAAPITESSTSKDKPVRKKSDSVVVVFDLDKQAWRSFKLTSVLYVTVA